MSHTLAAKPLLGQRPQLVVDRREELARGLSAVTQNLPPVPAMVA